MRAAVSRWWIASLGPPPLGDGVTFSTTVVDREGRLLRPFATPDGRWRLPAQAEDVDRRYLDLLIAYEDKRFRDHVGVDPFALLRAARQLIGEGRIVSGGSTLTMQVARLLEPRSERSVIAKLRQIVRAVEIERTLSKDEVLTLYLSLAPYGGNLEGVRAASLAYFGKEPRRLTLGEAALLVALPQSPEARRPDRSPSAARAARDRVLDRVAASGVLAGRRYRARKSRAGAVRAAADADAGAACGGSRGRRRSRRQQSSPDHRCGLAEKSSRTWRASARVRSARIFPSRSSPSTMPAAKSWPRSRRRIISTRAVRARST